jgi:iron(III) transport system ATP-binding protein
MTDDSYLSIRNVTKRFGDFVALNDVSLDVKKGEFVCFLGPSGCGKTTLLRAIAGLDIQQEGKIIQNKQDISNLPPSNRDFGIVFQSYALFPNLTVSQNVGFGLMGKGWSKAKIQARVDELLLKVGLDAHAQKYPSQISGGQQQRVALARALANSPGLLLLDEPLSALDAKVRVRLRSELKQLQRSLGITTIMVTHDQDEALALADKIVVMSDGRIEQVGTPEEIYTRPASAFVADFVGSMNFLSALVVDRQRVRVGVREFDVPDLIENQTNVTLAFRPEDVRIFEGENRHENLMSLQVKTREFCGSYIRATLASPEIGSAVITADISKNMASNSRLFEVPKLDVYIPKSALRVFEGGWSALQT